jgi:hypothetical protein
MRQVYQACLLHQLTPGGQRGIEIDNAEASSERKPPMIRPSGAASDILGASSIVCDVILALVVDLTNI